METASVRLDAPSFMRMLLTWNFTVERLTNSFLAISGLLRPSTMSRRISSSRVGQALVGLVDVGGRSDEHLRGLGSQGRPALVGGADGAGQLVGRDVLEQIADGAGPEGPLHQLLFFVAGEGDDLHVRALGLDETGGFGAVDVGHDQVHEHHVGLDCAALADRLGSTAGFADELEIVIHEKERGEPAAHHSVIVHDHHANRIIRHTFLLYALDE